MKQRAARPGTETAVPLRESPRAAPDPARADATVTQAVPPGSDARIAFLPGSPRQAVQRDAVQRLQAGAAAVAQRRLGTLAAGQASRPMATWVRQWMAEAGRGEPRRESAVSRVAGLPPGLKAGIESLSGIAMGTVRVHHDSDRPARIGALAFAQGRDIHLAPGQDRHLPHDAWHVVQQAQGRVAPTLQLKDGLAVNDDGGLEREADVMGQRAAEGADRHRETASSAAPGDADANPAASATPTPGPLPPASGPMVQRRVTYRNPHLLLIHEVKEALKSRLLARKKIFEPADQLIIDSILGLEFHGGRLFKALERLAYDPTDYGIFDLSDDQHLALLFFEIKKHFEESTAKEKPEIGREAAEREAEQRALEQRAYFSKSPNPGLTFETAILGAGAATAYYLTTQGRGLDPMHTIVIGEPQPWGSTRGPGVINHPFHMISALREAVGLGDEALAPRFDFSKIIEQVINQRVIHRRPNQVVGVKKISNEGEAFYKIDVRQDTSIVDYFAKKVVVGLGIGTHAIPNGLDMTLTAANKKAYPDESEHIPPILNMDEFQWRADAIAKIKDPRSIQIVISGPNAGLDVVKTSMEKGFTIIWIIGGSTIRPPFLPGTDNEIVEAAYDLAIDHEGMPLPRNDDRQIALVVKGRAGVACRNEGYLERGERAINVALQGGVGGSVPCDFYVYANGPEFKGMTKLFDKASVRDRLVPTYDTNRQFGMHGLPAVVGVQVENELEADKTSLEFVGGSAFRMASSVKFDYLTRESRRLLRSLEVMHGLQSAYSEIAKPLIDFSPRVATIEQWMLGAFDIARKYLENASRQAATLEIADPNKIPGLIPAPDFGQPPATLNEVDNQPRLDKIYRAFLSHIRSIHAFVSLQAEFALSLANFPSEKKTNPLLQDPRSAAAHMSRVVDTLPLNIALNDQLTPTRSQIEATSAFVPSYISSDVNFATDSSTVLAIYIARNYPKLSADQIHEWVDRIIRWRRPSEDDRKSKYKLLWGPLPNPNGKPREDARSFGEWFKKRLGEENDAL